MLQRAKQDYSPQPKIDGVKLIELRTFGDDGGFFLELGRWTNNVMNHLPDFNLQQMNYSEVDPGAVKAWHLHDFQEDIWFVPPSQKLLVALKDVRENSPSKDALMRLTLGRGKAQLLLIPRGVAHGAANLWQQSASIIYFVNNQFAPEPDKNDEYRLPYDAFGPEIWQMTKG